jgi:hypoxanthine phosphoribosyltransferase
MDESTTYKKILYTPEQVAARIKEMANTITSDYKSDETIFVSLLNGAQPFTARLMHEIQNINPNFHPNVQSMILSRYGPSREPTELRVVTDLPPEYRDLQQKKVILLDDLVDAGGTLEFAKQLLLSYGASQVECVVLVKKRKDPPLDFEPKLVGFEAPDVWLTGMGMDDARVAVEGNRWASWIAEAND